MALLPSASEHSTHLFVENHHVFPNPKWEVLMFEHHGDHRVSNEPPQINHPNVDTLPGTNMEVDGMAPKFRKEDHVPLLTQGIFHFHVNSRDI